MCMRVIVVGLVLGSIAEGQIHVGTIILCCGGSDGDGAQDESG